MTDTMIVGLLGTFLPLFAVGYLMLNKNAGVFRMYVAMLVVGVGYLAMTGAIDDIGARFLGREQAAVAPADAPSPAVESAPAAAAPKTETAPVAEPAKEETKTAPAEAPAEAATAPAEEKAAEPAPAPAEQKPAQ